MFEGRKLLIATKHHKEIVMAKHLQSSLGVLCEVTKNYDTDLLGTFSGEIERNSSPLETVKQKCIGAMEKYGYDLGVANEGSFGPHPTLFFVPANEEFIIFIDKKNDLEIVVKKLSPDTNFSGRNIKSEIELEKFIKAVHFPSHAVILRKSAHQNEEIIKDITVSYCVSTIILSCCSSGTCRVNTIGRSCRSIPDIAVINGIIIISVCTCGSAKQNYCPCRTGVHTFDHRVPY